MIAYNYVIWRWLVLEIVLLCHLCSNYIGICTMIVHIRMHIFVLILIMYAKNTKGSFPLPNTVTQTDMRHSRHAQLEKSRSLKAVATYLPLAQYGNREKGTKLA